MRATILGHRDIVRLSIGRIPLGPNALRYADACWPSCARGGLPDALAVAGQQLLISIVIGFAIDETGEGGQPPADAPPPATPARWPATTSPRCRPTASRTSSRVAEQFAADDPDQRFELLLDLFVDGLAQRAHRRS